VDAAEHVPTARKGVYIPNTRTRLVDDCQKMKELLKPGHAYCSVLLRFSQYKQEVRKTNLD
jgi:hypothetical protein